MNKRSLRIAGWAIGLSLAFGAIGTAVGASQAAPIEASAAATASNAATGTLTFTAASGPTMNQSGTIPTGASATFVTTGGALDSGCIRLSGKTATATLTITLSNFKDYAITGLSFTGKSNSKAGTGSLSLTAGSTTLKAFNASAFNTSNWGGSSYATTIVSRTITLSNDSYKIKKDENVVLQIEDTVNSLYFETISFSWEHVVPTMAYTDGGTTANLNVIKNSTNTVTFTASNFSSVTAGLFSNNPTNANATKATLAYSVSGTTVTITATGTAAGNETFTISATGSDTTLTLNVSVQESTTFDSLVITTDTTSTVFEKDAEFAVNNLVVTANYTVGGSPSTTVFSAGNSNLEELVYKLDDTTEIEIGDALTVTGNHTIVIYYTDSATSTTKSTSSYGITINAYVPHTYTKVESAPADYRGTYLFIFEGGDTYTSSVALNPKSASFNASNNFVSVSISQKRITGSKTLDQCAFAVVRDSEGLYRITYGSGADTKYLAAGSGSIALNESKTDNGKITFTNTDEIWFNEANYLRFNEGWPGFRGYGSGKQTAVSMYKMDYSSSSSELTTFVNGFHSATTTICANYATNTAASFSSAWASQTTAFGALSPDAQGVLANTTYVHGKETTGSRADIIDRYDYIISKYATLSDFMNRKGLTGVYQNNYGAASVNGLGSFGAKSTSNIALIIAVTSLGLAAAGGLLFLHHRHRKED